MGALTLICERCKKEVAKNGEIVEGKPYHTNCFSSAQYDTRMADYQTLYKTFADIDIDHETLTDLYSYFVEDGSETLEDLIKDIKGKWVVITRGLDSNGNGGIEMEVFSTKLALTTWIADTLKENFSEPDAHWEISYILNKGAIIAHWNQFKIKVSF